MLAEIDDEGGAFGPVALRQPGTCGHRPHCVSQCQVGARLGLHLRDRGKKALAQHGNQFLRGAQEGQLTSRALRER